MRLAPALLASSALLASAQMNGDAPGGLYHRSAPEKGLGQMLPVPHAVAHPGSFVDAYSPALSTHYGEVFWTMMNETKLPADFVARFANKTVAITGYECDSVRTLPDGTEEHVPIYDQYNHHHAAWVIGAGAAMVDLGVAGGAGTHGHGRWGVRDRPKTRAEMKDAPPGVKPPTSVYLVDGNGGEYRMTLHGTHRGTAMLVESPSIFRITPMMINTKHPEGKAPGQWSPEHIPSGAYGRARGATPPTNAAGEPSSLYSPLLECPCTDRKPKVITQHNTLDTGHCEAKLDTAAACFGAVAALGLLPISKNATVASTSSPSGCYVTTTQTGYEAFFNTGASEVACGASANVAAPLRAMGSASPVEGVEVSVDLDGSLGNCSVATADLAGEWTCTFGCTVLGQPGTPYGIEITDGTTPGAYSIVAHQGGGWSGKVVAKGSNVTFITPASYPPVTISSDFLTWTFANGVVWKRAAKTCAGEATITITGPADVWHAVGFDAREMKDAYAVVVDGTGAVTERQLGNGPGVSGAHTPGALLTPSVTVKSSTVADGTRTVVLTRPLRGASPKHATFVAAADGMPIISAVGNSATLSYHKARAAADLFLVKVGAPMCICKSFGTASGTIGGAPFGNKCPPALLNDHQGLAPGNDVCDITTYEGGLKCCSHGSILLDLNQTVPTEKDTYRMKFRIYYEEYTNQSEAFFMFQAIDAGGEYEVPQAKPGTPPSESVHTVSQDFTVAATLGADVNVEPHRANSQVLLLRASTHCHAPSCINETLYNLDTGEVICYNAPLYGHGSWPKSGQSFDEQEYAAGIPPCYWGSEEDGLAPPPRLNLTTRLRSVKHCNNTYYHLGVMAQWQMRGMWAPPL
jgi:hypothetical protein